MLYSLAFISCQEHNKDAVENYDWPEISNTTKPWTRWWWMGNIVDKEGIKQRLIDFSEAGLGGVEIAPIYGVKGEEDNFIDFLSPKWVEMLDYTIATADSLNMQVDLTLGTGWPYGGPQVTKEHAATKLVTNTYKVAKGSSVDLKIAPDNDRDKETAVLKYVLAYGDDGSYLDLTDELEGTKLKWTAKEGNYTLYAIFTGKTGQQVKRSAPGGEGYTVDHYSNDALKGYLARFDASFSDLNGKVRAIFNDSYEVYNTDFTPNFFEEFQERRGYDLRPYLNLLLDTTSTDLGNRFKSDYRETLSDLLLEDFDEPWTAWANDHQFKSRLQAHGSPGNLIDMYASADIPECETFGSMPFDIEGFRREKEDIREGDADAVMLKFSSSAAHISGKPLTSAETFTWLRDHFKTALSQCKPEAEELLLNGINHIFLHGSTYSPERVAWPGWKFYASVNFNPTNTIWEDVPSLFSYIANCQSFLQAGKADNETLVYWPIYDVWDKGGKLFYQVQIHSLKEWLHGTSFYEMSRRLMDEGYGVDFISDDFISKATVVNGKLQLPGGTYKSMLIPNCKNMPLKTMEKLVALKNDGAHIIFEGIPETVPGYYQYEEQNEKLTQLSSEITSETNLFQALEEADIYPETLVKTGLKFNRRDIDGEKVYYLVNHTAETIGGFIPLQADAEAVVMYDPLNREFGKAIVKKEESKTLVKVDIASGESIILKTGKSADIQPWNYYEPSGAEIEITGDWKISFLKGGPKLPEESTMSTLGSWTTLGEDEENFSGTASYTIEFDKPDSAADNWKLSLGDVRESAKVWVNGKQIGTAWSAPFELNIGELKVGKNTLKIQVTNLAANRIRAKEMRGEEWKIFYEINMVNKDYQKFDATVWNPMPSGLLGPISITPLKLSTKD
ncbi:glycoside hydrolase [Muricauda sp. CAU 1633]|nr:glycoside hydrolase [Muricauda sp. CAU 1633]